ncbi:hypothetical protein RN001_010907 [Aquatica leii]|uniref:Sodium channel protein Nach n=1 Tax=Aquatica leii TaxID=1421715 RepID=A0AAN7S8R6_9COLE|nr:hypothetical protein RN001_010907 [Aquatica leii]
MTSAIREYLLNTSFHGVRYLAERDRHWTERVFWLTCCVLSWFASGLLMKASWYDFQNNAISFVVETNFLDWNTSFPAVAVCETENQDNIATTTDALFGDPHDYNIDEMINELVFFRGLSYYLLQLCGPNTDPHPQCITSNFSQFQSYVRTPCSKLFKKCMWNQVEFDCCTYFSKLDTELGTCYPHYKMISNVRIGPGTFYVELYGFNNVYPMSQYDVPTLITSQADVIQISPNIHFRRFISFKEIVNQPEVRDVSLAQRNCRFAEESYLDVYKYYSYSACNVQCRKEAQISMCNCTHHYMPNTSVSQQCNLLGIECLNKHYNDLAVLKAHWTNRPGLVCSCIPSCTDIEMTVIRDEKFGIYEDLGIVEIALERLPSERFKRNVVRGKLDLVVSMGGSVGLFVGASILSFVEIIYFFTLRVANTRNNKNSQDFTFPYVN